MPREPVADHLDEYEHFGNRRLRTVGELIQEAFRIGLYRMERVVRERLTTEDADTITPQTIINIRPVVAALKEFFGSSQLVAVHGPDELAVRPDAPPPPVSALGAGGLTRERAPIEVRDVHPTHYGRMCPIETPEGPNIGLIGSLSCYAEVSEHGFVTTPYRVVEDGHGDRRDRPPRRHPGGGAPDRAGERRRSTRRRASSRAPTSSAARRPASTCTVAPKDVDLMDVSPEQIWSVATAMIPFLEHDDANRALMGSNMQRQAVPLLKTDAPLIGTGMERRAALDTGDVLLARNAGTVAYVDADAIVDRRPRTARDEYELQKFMRSNQGTLIHQKPRVETGPAGQGRRRARRRLGDRPRRDGAGQEPDGRLHVLGGLQLRGRDHPVATAWSRTTSSPRSTSRSTRSTPARPSWATRRSRATSRTARRSRCATSTTAASSASAPRSAPATCSSARSRRRARPS